MSDRELHVSPEQYAKLQDSIARSGYGSSNDPQIAEWLRSMGYDPRDFMYRQTQIIVDYNNHCVSTLPLTT